MPCSAKFSVTNRNFFNFRLSQTNNFLKLLYFVFSFYLYHLFTFFHDALHMPWQKCAVVHAKFTLCQNRLSDNRFVCIQFKELKLLFIFINFRCFPFSLNRRLLATDYRLDMRKKKDLFRLHHCTG